MLQTSYNSYKISLHASTYLSLQTSYNITTLAYFSVQTSYYITTSTYLFFTDILQYHYISASLFTDLLQYHYIRVFLFTYLLQYYCINVSLFTDLLKYLYTSAYLLYKPPTVSLHQRISLYKPPKISLHPRIFYRPSKISLYLYRPSTLHYIRVSLFSDLLQYHYIRGTYYSAGLMDGDKIQTVQGTDVVIHKTNGNSANLVRLKNYLNYFYIFSLQRHLSWFFPKYIHWFALLLFLYFF